jgi:hypothetical protein
MEQHRTGDEIVSDSPISYLLLQLSALLSQFILISVSDDDNVGRGKCCWV